MKVGGGCRDGLRLSSRRYRPYTTPADTNRRVPSYDQFGSWERRVRLLNDYLKHGYTHRDLAAK
jgi:hypothetical protein